MGEPQVIKTSKHKSMKLKLLRMLKTLIADVRQAYVPAVILFLVGGSGAVLLIYKKTLAYTIQLARTPTPLWATILLVLLCGLYSCLHIKKNCKKQFEKKSSYPPVDIANQKNEKYQFRDNLLWFPNDPAPFCPVCYETNSKKVHMLFHQESDTREEWEYYECHTCGVCQASCRV